MADEIKQEKPKGNLLAVIRIRGIIGLTQKITDTLKMLNLFRKNCCSVVENTPSNLGMIKKAKDYITWGEIDQETLKLLIEKRSEINPKDPKKTKKFFRLNSPKGGFEKKGIKVPFVSGGVLGSRGKKINDLLKKMI